MSPQSTNANSQVTKPLSDFKKWSLKTRLIVSGLLLNIVLLPFIGLTVNSAFEQQIQQSVEDQLRAYVYSVLALVEVENAHIVMPEYLLENQFNVIDSGLYAVITTNKDIVWQSSSAFSINLESANWFLSQANFAMPSAGQTLVSEIMVNESLHLAYSFGVSIELSDTPLSIAVTIIKDEQEYQQQIANFKQTLWTWLIVLMIVLIAIQAIWLYWTLKPLGQFTLALNEVEQGKAEQLPQNFPLELNTVARALNTVLSSQKIQHQRYRNALADLAHSLKTPLAVLQSQGDLSAESIEQTAAINRIINYQLNKAKTTANKSWAMTVNVDETANKLIQTMAKLYQDANLDIDYKPSANAVFRGDEADLNEMLGNLLDNACKAAVAQVCLSVVTTPSHLYFVIEDDGAGVSNEQATHIFERGIRADTYHQGHGIGLAIVQDLVNSYQGSLSVSESADYGGAKFELRFLR